MNKQIFITILFFAFLISFTSCKIEKKYYYVEDGKKEKLINAYSDSAAYMEAYQNFEITKKVYADMKKSFGDSYLDKPISFELLNDKHEDITYKVFFSNKDSLEKECANRINELPNNIEQSVVYEKVGVLVLQMMG